MASLVPDDALLQGLQTAAGRGVDVTLIVDGIRANQVQLTIE